MAKRTKIENYPKLYYEKNKDKIREKNLKYYYENKETRKCLIKLDGRYINGIFHYGNWRHTTTMHRVDAKRYNYRSALKIKREYEKIGVKVTIIMLQENEDE